MLQYHLELLSKVVDSEIFREACKCVAEVLNRLFYNTLIMETQFSVQVRIPGCMCDHTAQA